jgi:FkbM family methyltransferase
MMRHADLFEALKRGVTSQRQHRIKRMFSNPVRTLLPLALKRQHAERHVEAQTFHGATMHVVLPEPISTSIWRYGVFETDVSFYLLKVLRSGDTFVDVGGHFGYFSLLARTLIGADGLSVTFEPMPPTLAILRRNIEHKTTRNRCHIVQAAAGSEQGSLTFKFYGLTNSAYSTSGDVRTSELASLQPTDVPVDVVTVDDTLKRIGATACRLIKIDAENAELAVLQGATQTIKGMRPAVILETGDSDAGESASRKAISFLLDRDYVAYEFKDWDMVSHKLQDRYDYKNILMVPTEHQSDMIGVHPS